MPEYEYIVVDYNGGVSSHSASEWLTRKAKELKAELVNFNYGVITAYAVFKRPK